MLVIARKLGERVMIGDAVVVKVCRIDRGVVRLGIDAPPAVRVIREELAERPEPVETDEEQLLREVLEARRLHAAAVERYEAAVARRRAAT